MPTELPTIVPEGPPSNPPPRGSLRPSCYSALGAVVGADTKIDVFDLPDRKRIPSAKIAFSGGPLPVVQVWDMSTGTHEDFQVKWKTGRGLYIDNSTLVWLPGMQMQIYSLSPPYSVGAKPIAGFLIIHPDDPET